MDLAIVSEVVCDGSGQGSAFTPHKDLFPRSGTGFEELTEKTVLSQAKGSVREERPTLRYTLCRRPALYITSDQRKEIHRIRDEEGISKEEDGEEKDENRGGRRHSHPAYPR